MTNKSTVSIASGTTQTVPKRREADVVSREITALYGHIKDAFGKVQELAVQCLLNHDIANNPALCNKMIVDMPRGIKKQSPCRLVLQVRHASGEPQCGTP